jgi:hypothetical protein
MARKKRRINSYSILIVPDTKDNPKNFTISSFTMRIMFLVAITIAVLIIAGAASYWSVASVALDYLRLEEENFQLRTSLGRVESMRQELSQMQKMNSEIRETLTGYVQVDKIAANDSTERAELNFNKLDPEKRRTIFNSIPSLMPVEGFMTRGYQVEDLIVDPHYGIDIAASKGTPIKATADGTVLFSGWTLEAGYLLIIKHNYGFTTVYKHNERNLVSTLEKVKKGQVVGLVGDSGKISSGAHVHFEIWKNGQPLDPLRYVNTTIVNKN